MKKIFIVLPLLLLFSFRVHAQLFSNTYANSAPVVAKNSLQSLVAHPKGSLTINVNPGADPVLTFLDVNGNVVWSKAYALQGEPLVINAGVLTENFNFIVVGSYASFGFAMRIDDNNGAIMWSNLYAPNNYTYYSLSFTGVVRTGEPAENYVMAGTLDPTIQDLPAALYFQNIDGATGNTNWVRSYHDAAFAPPIQPERVAFTVSHLARNPQNSHPNGDIMVVGHTYNDQQKYHIFTIGIDEVTGGIIKVYEEVIPLTDALHPHITFDGQGDYLLYYQLGQWLAALKTQFSSSTVAWAYQYGFPSFSENVQCSAVPTQQGYKLNGWGYDFNMMQRKPFIFDFDNSGIPIPSTGVWSYNANAQNTSSSSMVYAFGTTQTVLTHGTADDFFTEGSYDVSYASAACLKEELPTEVAIPASFMPVKFRIRKDGYYVLMVYPNEKDWKHKVLDCEGNNIARPALASEATVPAATLTVAPNPTESLLTLDGRAFAADQVLTVRDVTGKAVLTTTLAAGQQQTLDVAALPAGLYLITSANQQIAVRFVKK